MDGESLFQALGDDTRLRIVNLLTHGEFNVSEIVSVLDSSQPKISRHLSYLRRSGLVQDRKFHNQVLYSIDTHEKIVKEHLVPLLNHFFKKSYSYSDDKARFQKVLQRSNAIPPKCCEKKRVLIICEHNAARSQMAQAFFNCLGENCIEAYSAGLSPSGLHQDVIKVMKEKGYDISHQRSRNLQDYIENKDHFDTIITVCDESLLNHCPQFPGEKERVHWILEDPSKYFTGDNRRLNKVRKICDQIESRVRDFIRLNKICVKL